MTIQTDTSNQLHFKGRIVHINDFGKTGNAANISIAVENKRDGKTRTCTIQTKCFQPAIYNTAKVGMLVEIHGHVDPSKYTDKNGKPQYSQDLVADYVEFLESKAVVDAREAAKKATPNPNEVADFE
jgi:single-stranded DNA-binding protein